MLYWQTQMRLSFLITVQEQAGTGPAVLTLRDGERQVPALHPCECQAAQPLSWLCSTWYQPMWLPAWGDDESTVGGGAMDQLVCELISHC